MFCNVLAMFSPRIDIITKAAARGFVFDIVCGNISGLDCKDVNELFLLRAISKLSFFRSGI
jgi:hypothetical protein